MILITDIETFGYKNVEINHKVTDLVIDPKLNYSIRRVHIDTHKGYLIIDLGRGRQIRIKFNSNENELSREGEYHE